MDYDLKNFFVIGFSYQSSSLEFREELALTLSNPKLYMKELKVAAVLQELLLLSTCNRFEIYAYSEYEQSVEQVIEFVSNKVNKQSLQKYYILSGEQAFRHLSNVSSGIDSMVQGETQIFGQVKQAYKQAFESEVLGRFLHKTFQAVFSLSKKIRTDTKLGHNSLSVAGISVKLIQQIFTDLSKLKIVVIGSGEIAELALIHLKAVGCDQITIVNRTIRNAEDLAERFNAQAAGLHRLPEFFHDADVIFGSLRIDKPIFQIRDLKNLKRNRSLIFIDLGLPRNFQSAIRDLDDFYLYDISDLESLALQNKANREESVKDAELLIENSLYNFENWLVNIKSEPWRCGTRERLHSICSSEAQKLFKNKISSSSIDLFAHKVAQKLAVLLEDNLLAKQSVNILDREELEIIKKELNA